jgi:Kef-type K+ transport system membrane component KefB
MPLRIVMIGAGLLLSAATASAAEVHGNGGLAFGPLLVGIAVLVVGAKLGGVLVARWGQPSVLGELLFGIVLANLVPALFGEVGIEFVRSSETLRFLAEIGVLLLLFDVGLEIDLSAFLKVGASAVLVAVAGVIAPLGLGWASARWLLPESPTLVHVFVGATLCATSVGITARVLKDLGVTGRPESQTIIGAAILDDVLGLIVLAVVAGSVSGAASGINSVAAVSIAAIVLKAVGFLGITVVLGHFLSRKIVRMATRSGEHGVLLVIGVALCFTFAYIAELVGLADIVGAFAAGMFLDPYGEGVYLKKDQATLRELLGPLSDVLVPLFFVLMGLQVNLAGFTDPSVLALGFVLIASAIAGKLACAAGVIRRGIRRWPVAIGMIPRGEVGLIFAGIGASLSLEGAPILSEFVYSAIVVMVVVTTLITPIGLRWAFQK